MCAQLSDFDRRLLDQLQREVPLCEQPYAQVAKRISSDESQVVEQSVSDADFPDMALGAAASGEMSGQMITKGWKIQLGGAGKTYEYRADKTQLRLCNFKGKNYKI